MLQVPVCKDTPFRNSTEPHKGFLHRQYKHHVGIERLYLFDIIHPEFHFCILAHCQRDLKRIYCSYPILLQNPIVSTNCSGFVVLRLINIRP